MERVKDTQRSIAFFAQANNARTAKPAKNATNKRHILRAFTLSVIAVIATMTAPPAHAAWRVVVDPYCTAAVTTNLATQKAIEDQHNKRLDSIASKKRKLEMYTVSMATIKELYKLTMENVSGFGTESKYYTEMMQNYE